MEKMPVKVITLRQPWATLVALGEKKIETRSWGTNYRGPLLIHASAGFIKAERWLCLQEPFKTVLSKHGLSANDLPLGKIIAETTLVKCLQMIDEDWNGWNMSLNEYFFGFYTKGRYGWFLGETRRLPEPIPAKGSLGLWEYNVEACDGKTH